MSSAYQAKAVYGVASIPGGRRIEARKRTSSTPRRCEARGRPVAVPEASWIADRAHRWGRRTEVDGAPVESAGRCNPRGDLLQGASENPAAHPSVPLTLERPRPTTPHKLKAEATEQRVPDKREDATSAAATAASTARPANPPRPSTPCMNRGDGARRKRISSAGRPQGRPSNSSVGMRMFQLESRLLGNHRAGDEEKGGAASEAQRVRPASSGSRAHPTAGKISSKLIEEAMEMCRQSQAGSSAATVCSATEAVEVPVSASPPPDQLERPNAPTPEQTNHWLQGMEAVPAAAPVSAHQEQWKDKMTGRQVAGCVSPRDERSQVRPRSPTPTKMLAWGEEEDTPSCSNRAVYFSPSDDDDPFGRGDHSDGLIHRLIEACQMDDVRRAFGIYERLRRLRVPLYEGVYKLIIECCMRTHQLGHGIQFYETLKSSGQRVSSRIIIVLIEACAREQHSEKVHALWQDWCQPHEDLRPCHREVLMVTLAALVRTLSPDLALELLRDARERFDDSTWVLNVEAEVQELLQLIALAASEAQQNGSLGVGGSLASYHDLQALLIELLDEAELALGRATPRPRTDGGAAWERAPFRQRSEGLMAGDALMEDVDLDLELAAM